MRPFLAPGFLCCYAFLCCATFCQLATAQQSTPDPQIVAAFNGISAHAARMEPMLQQLKPDDWVAKGAPDTYVTQFNSAIEQMHAIQSEMSALAQHPEQMTECMKALFRVQSSHRALISLMEGLRRWQNPALAELIESVAAEDRTDLDLVEQYVLQLATEKDQQYAVVDSEAQRCRATLSRQPADTPKPNKRTQ
jgi:hypothetical protein